MSPDQNARKRPKAGLRREPSMKEVRCRPSSDDAHHVMYFKRHVDDDPAQATPGRDFMNACPASVQANMAAVLTAVAAAPPKRFAGGGYWEAMHGDMTGWFEVRVNGPRRTHYRLFCLLDYEAEGMGKPLLVIIDGRSKLVRTELSAADYEEVRSLGQEYWKRNPRSLV